MKLRFTPRAERDLADIADHLCAESAAAAWQVRSAILATLQILVEFPGAGRLQSVEAIRKAVVRKYPYLIYYTVDSAMQELVVLAVQHTARERPHRDR